MATLTEVDRYWMTKQREGRGHSGSSSIDMKRVASIILSGGEGTRLYPLTMNRSKPAVSFGGKYRLIDVPISNSLHAECSKIFVLTQFLSSSLHHHIFQTYVHQHKSKGSIEILTAEQKRDQKDWYQGTADAVRKNLDYLLECPVDYFLILSGDQLYNINFRHMMSFARETDADMVIASIPVDEATISRMGVLKVDAQRNVTDFYEKPKDPAILRRFKCPKSLVEKVGLVSPPGPHYLASMGIYLFKRTALVELLKQDGREDFGKHLIPTMVESGKVAAFLYGGYWEDIGTIETYYKANMALTDLHPTFYLHDQERPIFSYPYELPPSRLYQTQIKQTILSEGSIIEADEINRCLLGPRTVIHKGSIIRDSYLMGNDYYYAPVQDHHRLPLRPHIGEDCIIRRAIIDKNVCIGKGVQLINKQKLDNYDSPNVLIRDGIIVVPNGAVIPDGFIL